MSHDFNMMAMNYNLLFGAYGESEKDGVKREWGLYQDSAHGTQDFHPLPDSWASDIILLDPSNKEWQSFLFQKKKKHSASFLLMAGMLTSSVTGE